LHREQIQVSVNSVELHDREPNDAPPITRCQHDAIAITQAPFDAFLVPRPREPMLDEPTRHACNRGRVVDVGQT
jgi:hypothetical protein